MSTDLRGQVLPPPPPIIGIVMSRTEPSTTVPKTRGEGEQSPSPLVCPMYFLHKSFFVYYILKS